ncbi:hypothetical protein SELMODRAFT_439685 [Selaginella moellendorffii]|uniref:DUF1640 domain-containing protein n=2 Tax=Selaginella moellendorffii TaxID=88036 RepID=D8R519_SELML|nr:uncharacterized protein LOC9652593 isoform X1 [Selaginella moellendorffii]EFJ32766.1 hypothetical protein SELMODRAFT_439685 [Selaginella moellendorffii]|eukprot:XP_002966739.1 uncharacterized protein LOC9652593 isoform X1 [Selaginella moellendorffii]
MVLRSCAPSCYHRYALHVARRRKHSMVASASLRRASLALPIHLPPPPPPPPPSCSTPPPLVDVGDYLEFWDHVMSGALRKSLRKVLRKKKLATPTALWCAPPALYVDPGPSSSSPSFSLAEFSLQAARNSTSRQRLNWNPLSLRCRQLSVRHNTQPAQTPPTSPSNPSSSLLLTSSVAPPTVPASSNARRAFLVDTLAVMRRLEAQELNQRQAEAITAVVTSVLNDSLESVAHSYTSKTDMQKCEMMHDASLSKFKAEMQSSLEHHFATLQRESERLRTDMEKMRSELRYEIDKVQANQRLDLNLERGHIRDELNKQQAETSNLTNKLDREIHGLKTQLEAGKYEVIKYCIGTIVSITAVGLGLLRIIM